MSISRREFLFLGGTGALAVALGIKACEPKKEPLSPLEQKFYRKSKELLRQDLTDLPLRMTVSANDGSARWATFNYRDRKLSYSIFPKDESSQFVTDNETSKHLTLVDDDFINIPETGLVYAFSIEEKVDPQKKIAGPSWISKLKVFSPAGHGKGVLFEWSPYSNKNAIELEKEIYLRVEAESQWPWHIHVKTTGFTISDYIAIPATTLWHPLRPADSQQQTLTWLVNEWRVLVVSDVEGKRSRLELTTEFAQKVGKVIKSEIVDKNE